MSFGAKILRFGASNRRYLNFVFSNNCSRTHLVFHEQWKNSLKNSVSSHRSVSSSATLWKAKDRGKDKKKQVKVQHIDFNEINEVLKADEITKQLDKLVEDMKHDFVKNLTIRTSIGAIEQLPVSFEGKDYTLEELVQIVRKPKMLVLNVSLFPQVIPQILQALDKSGMNLNPQQDGTSLFVPLPKVTKEHREKLAKSAKSIFIRYRDSIKDVQNKNLRTLKKKTGISEDLVYRIQGHLQALSEKYITEAQKILENKEKELLNN